MSYLLEATRIANAQRDLDERFKALLSNMHEGGFQFDHSTDFHPTLTGGAQHARQLREYIVARITEENVACTCPASLRALDEHSIGCPVIASYDQGWFTDGERVQRRANPADRGTVRYQRHHDSVVVNFDDGTLVHVRPHVLESETTSTRLPREGQSDTC